MRALTFAALQLAAADSDVERHTRAVEQAADLHSKGYITTDQFKQIKSELGREGRKLSDMDLASGDVAPQGDVAQSKCLASMLSDTASAAQDCMDNLSNAANPVIVGIVQYLTQYYPTSPECPDFEYSGGGSMKPPCGKLPDSILAMDTDHNCPTSYPFMKAGTGCTAHCNAGPAVYQYYCPPDNDAPMSTPIPIVPEWAISEGLNEETFVPRCCAEQPNCEVQHEGYKCASDDSDMVMCFIGANGFYVDESFETQICENSCRSCWGSSTKRCTSCYDGYWLDNNVTEFPSSSQYLHQSSEGDYEYAQCTRCHADCVTCDGPGPEHCLQRACHEDYCTGNLVLVDGWEDIICAASECEQMNIGRRAMLYTNHGKGHLQSQIEVEGPAHRRLSDDDAGWQPGDPMSGAQEVCCEEVSFCNQDACSYPQFILKKDGSWEDLKCQGPQCVPELDQNTCCERGQEVCNESACLPRWYIRADADNRYCSGFPCEQSEEDNARCCVQGAWLDWCWEQTDIRGKQNFHRGGGDWDSARYSEWMTTGMLDLTLRIDQGPGSQMIGPCRRTGIGYWSHMHSGGWDAHPDGWAFYSDNGPYDWYGGASWSHVDGCCYGWRTGDYLRMEMNLDERWNKWYLTRPGTFDNVHWGTCSNFDLNGGVAFCVSLHNQNEAVTIMDHEDGYLEDELKEIVEDPDLSRWLERNAYNGRFLDWGGDGWEQQIMDHEEERRNIKHFHHGSWKSWRTSLWQKEGFSAIWYRIDNYYNDQMMGFIRGDYVMYENHMHSGSQGDHHPDGWNWYNAGMGFHNYDPWGANFYHDRGDIGGYQDGDYMRFEMDFRGGSKQVAIYLTSPQRNYDDVRVCRWTDMDLGNKGVAFGGSLYDGENSGVAAEFTIVPRGWEAEEDILDRGDTPKYFYYSDSLSWYEWLEEGSDLAELSDPRPDPNRR